MMGRHGARRFAGTLPGAAILGAAFLGAGLTGCWVSDEDSERAESASERAAEAAAEAAEAAEDEARDLGGAVSEALRDGLHEAADQLATGLTGAAEAIGDMAVEMSEEWGGEARVENPLDFRDLYAFLPGELGAFGRVSREGRRGGLLKFQISSAEAEYESPSGARIDVTILDLGALPAVGQEGFVERLNLSVDEEDGRGWARTLEYRGYPALEEFQRSLGQRGRGEFVYLVEGRFLVVLDGRDLEMEDLYDLRDEIGTGGLARLRDREGS